MPRRLYFFFIFAIFFVIATTIFEEAHPAGQYTTQNKKIIVGRNVNMVSGTRLPNGDPFLQRQNEPSLAVSTRNPLHLLAGANDYRTVDMPGLPDDEVTGDSWLGVFKSYDGGESWISTLLPGYPQDYSIQGMSSPLKGYQAAADPVLRAGTNGLFYYSGIAFDREDLGKSVAFVARYIDNNNQERGDPIKYIDTAIIDMEIGETLIDKPWIAVDIPRSGSITVPIVVPDIPVQHIPTGNVYISYAVFSGKEESFRSKILFSRSTDCGATWSIPIEISEKNFISQGTTVAVDPRNGFIYVAWRHFGLQEGLDAIYITKSTNGGVTFTNPFKVTEVEPFDQGTTNISFRTNSYPTMTVDNSGNIYLAWSQRGIGLEGDSCIVLATSENGLKWSTPKAVDSPGMRGHQIMPSLTFAAGKLMMVWHDQRYDIPGFFDNCFGYFIAEACLRRRTTDIRVAQADPGLDPVFEESKQVSRYQFQLTVDGSDLYVEQIQFNPLNFPLFRQGDVPFHGDYIDIAPSPIFLRDGEGGWIYNTNSTQPAIFHTAWTDNRDIRPPPDNDWTNYTPPNSEQNPLFESNRVCSNGQKAGMRNQNIYTSCISEGIIVGSPQNTKPLNIQRTFVIFVKNTNNVSKFFRLKIINQPPGGSASFLQFADSIQADVKIPPFSSGSQSVFVQSSDFNASVKIDILEIEKIEGNIVGDGLQSTVVLNPDITNPEIIDPDYINPNILNPNILNTEVSNPNILNPNILNWNYDVVNPNILNPNILNPNILNPNILNPNILNPNILNPNILNPNILNPNILNPNILNPNILNPNILNSTITDVDFYVENNGNTTSSFTFKTISTAANEIGSLPDGLFSQLLVYRVHFTPTVLGTELELEPQHELVVNVVDPFIYNPWLINPAKEHSDIFDATFHLAPEDHAQVILRVYDADTGDTKEASSLNPFAASTQQFDPNTMVDGLIISGGVNLDDITVGGTTPAGDSTFLIIGTTYLNDGIVGTDYLGQLMAYGGSETLLWSVVSGSLPNELFLNTEGALTGIRTVAGTFTFTVQVSDPVRNKKSIPTDLTIRVNEPLVITTGSLPDGETGKLYTEILETSGGTKPFAWSKTTGSLPEGLTLNSSGVVSGVPIDSGTYNFSVKVSDSTTPPQIVPSDITLTIDLSSYAITGMVTADGLPLEGVSISGLPGSPLTDSSGNYRTTVYYNWSGTAIPKKTGYTFEPASRIYSNVTSNQTFQDYAATPGGFTISGMVTEDGVPLEGVSIGGLPGFPTTDATGFYVVSVNNGWTGTATPSKTGHTFSPSSRSYTNVASDQTGQNYSSTLVGYIISGKVTVAAISGLMRIAGFSGVVMNGLPGNPTTQADGSYSASVDLGWSGSVTPIKAGYSFDPSSTNYINVNSNQSGQNYSASLGTYMISGTVSVAGQGLEGVIIRGLPTDPTTDTSGRYTASVRYGWTGTATPLKTGYSFSPSNRSYSQVSSDKTEGHYDSSLITYTITTTAGSNGSISPSGPVSVNYGSDETFTILPDTNYHVADVIVDGSSVGILTTYTFTNVTSDHNIEATFALNTYTLTTQASPIAGGKVAKNPNQASYNHGTNVQLTATANTGYTFTGWSGDASGTTNPKTITMDSNKTVTANFSLNTYTLTTQANPAAGGTVAKNPDQAMYDHGTNVQITATPNASYTFTGWSGDATGTTNPIIVTMASNKTITANFSLNTYTLTTQASPAAGGYVAKNPDQASYNHGTNVQISATANSGYTFTGWSGDASGTTNPETITMDSNKTVTANFSLNTCTLTTQTSPAAGGSVAKNPDQASYDHGTNVQLTATANAGYTFAGWSDDASGTTNPVTLIMDSDKTVTADFILNSYTLTIQASPTVGGSVTKNPDQASYNHGTDVQITATVNAGYTFAGWSGDASGTTNPETITMDSNKTVTANFSLNTYTLTTQANPTTGGSVTKNPDQATYDHGTNVQLTADANAGFAFNDWSGDASGSTNPLSVQMTSNKTITANFGPEWVARYNGSGNDDDRARAVAVDSSGNIYVTGFCEGSGTDADIVTIKYDSSGSQLWVALHNGSGNSGDAGNAIVVDTSGNVYVTGQSDETGTGDDIATIKYDNSGTQLWVALYNGTGSFSDYGSAIDVDSSGNVYVTGTSTGSGIDWDFATIKYDSSGTQLWAKRYNGPGNDLDDAKALATDSSGNVYVTGYSIGSGTEEDYATIKYDGSGNQLWVARYDGPGNDYDEPEALAIDSSGNVYVTGYASVNWWEGGCTTLKYDGSGNQLWATLYDNPVYGPEGWGESIAVDSSENVYVAAGSSLVASGDYLTLKYNSSGVQQWASTYDGPEGDFDNAEGLTLDSIGNVYVTGQSEGNGTGDDIATIRYDNSGNQIWAVRYNGPASGDDIPCWESCNIALDTIGNVYVTGYSPGSGTGNDYVTIKYSQSFPNYLNITSTNFDNGTTGTSYATTVEVFGGSGTRSWSINSGNLPTGMNLNTTSGIISGTPTAAGTYNFTIKVTDGSLSDTQALSIIIN